MRFAYIDSNGNEVPIPSVDALALRIELGAINDETQLYDAQADQWGPATSHEIYHTLARSSGDDDGFVAPPPVVPPPVAPVVADDAPADELAAAEAGEDSTEPEVVDMADMAADEPVEPSAADALPDLDLTLAEAPEPEDAATPENDEVDDAGASSVEDDTDSSSSDDGGLGFGGLDLAPTLDPIEEDGDGDVLDSSVASAGADDDEPDDDDGGFDFGEMGGGLELEATFDPPDDTDGAMDFSAPAGGEMDLGGGMDVESSMDFSSDGFDGGGGGSLDLEQPMSDFSPDDPPAWMDQDGSGSGEESSVMDFSSDPESPDDVALRDRRTPRNKPSKPKHRRQRAMAGPIVGIVVLVAIGVGAYAAWPILRARIDARGGPEVRAVFIPQLSAELMPQMTAAAASSFEATFAAVRASEVSGNAIEAPSSDWLAGIYLANASDFDAVETFWDQMDEVLEGVRAIDLRAFDAALQVALGGSTGAATEVAAMRARADSGFVAAAPVRAATFDQVEVLIDAAVRLHQFLLANEANIAYAPATAVTTDPILEVNPATQEIRDAMEDLIDGVTSALGDLGYRDLVTADGIWAMVLAQIQDTGIE